MPKRQIIYLLMLSFFIGDYYYLFGHILLAMTAEFITPYSHRPYLKLCMSSLSEI